MEMDQVGSLRYKLLELKKVRDHMQQESATGAGEITQLEEHLRQLQALLDQKRRTAEERNGKLKRFDTIIFEAENAIRKLTENARKLEGVIERELSGSSMAKSSQA